MEELNSLTKPTLTDVDIQNRLSLLLEFLQCNEVLYLWQYDTEGNCLWTNSSLPIYDTMLRHAKDFDEIIAFGQEHDTPLMITSLTGMMWSVVYQKDIAHQLSRIHIIGPVFTAMLSDDTIALLQKRPDIREHWKVKLYDYLRQVPVVTTTNFIKYTLMLHFSINNEHLKPSDITYADFNYDSFADRSTKSVDYASYWARENVMLDIIRTGDIYRKSSLGPASAHLSNMQPHNIQELERTRQYTIIFIGLCIRAAIDGGVSPDTAFSRGNIYLNNLSHAKSYGDITASAQLAFDDFLFLVHNHLRLNQYSENIKACIDYIELHTDDDLNIPLLAEKIGYSDYYLSKKFKKEVGVNINAYIKKARVQKAAYLLVSSKMSIQEISDMLHFGNRNFFCRAFKEEMHTTPAAFRTSHQKY